MSISAQRFKFLDQETNLPVSDFLRANTSDILNIPTAGLQSITSALASLVDGGKQAIMDELKSIGDTTGLSEAIREAKDGISSVCDAIGLPTPTLDSITQKLTRGNTSVQSAFNQIGSECKNKIIGSMGGCNGSRDTLTINGISRRAGSGPCSTSTMSNLVNRMTAGSYSPEIMDPCAIKNAALGTISRSSEMNMPGVFTAFNNTTDPGIMSHVAANLIPDVSSRGDMYTVMEIANSSISNTVSGLLPDASDIIMRGYATPGDIRESELSSFYDAFTSSISKIDPQWNRGSIAGNDIDSAANLYTNNTALETLIKSKVYNVSPTPNVDGTVIPSTSEEKLLSAFKFNNRASISL